MDYAKLNRANKLKEQMADEAYEFLSVYIDSKLKNFNNEFDEL